MIRFYKLLVLSFFSMIGCITGSSQTKREVKAEQTLSSTDSIFMHTRPYGAFRTDVLVDGFKVGMTKDEVQQRKLELVAENKVEVDNSILYQDITLNGKTARLGYYFQYVNECDTCPVPVFRLGAVTLCTRNITKIDGSAGIFDAGDLKILLAEFEKKYPGVPVDTLYSDRLKFPQYQIVNGNIAIVLNVIKGQIGINYRDLVFWEAIMHNAWMIKEYPKVESGK